MIIYPAIDVRSGKCVRLYQGDFKKEVVYGESPMDMARVFMEQGATWLHLVDLDGANNPRRNQAHLIKEILAQVNLNIQIGGGIRTLEQVNDYLLSGASRIILGSLALQNPSIVLKWLKKYGGERFVLAFDVAIDAAGNPLVATHAWKRINSTNLFDIMKQYQPYGVRHVLCTDISRDGALNGPNVDLYQTVMDRFPEFNIQASGGVASLGDIRRLKKIGLSGAITGRALYENKFDLCEAISC